MKHFRHFWIITVVRGLLAIFVGCSVIVVPDMATTLLLLPFAMVLSVLGLAFYGTLDSALVFIASFNTDAWWPKVAQRVQGLIGVVAGVLMFTILFEHIQLRWFLYLVSLQAASLAVSEFTVARHVRRRHGSRRLFTTAALAGLACFAYLYAALRLGDNLSPREVAWCLYSYLLVFGIVQCFIGASMLYMELETDSPAISSRV